MAMKVVAQVYVLAIARWWDPGKEVLRSSPSNLCPKDFLLRVPWPSGNEIQFSPGYEPLIIWLSLSTQHRCMNMLFITRHIIFHFLLISARIVSQKFLSSNTTWRLWAKGVLCFRKRAWRRFPYNYRKYIPVPLRRWSLLLRGFQSTLAHFINERGLIIFLSLKPPCSRNSSACVGKMGIFWENSSHTNLFCTGHKYDLKIWQGALYRYN